MIDALIIGYNDIDLAGFVNSVRALGRGSGAYKDLSLAYLNHNGRPYRALDLLSHCHDGEDRPHPRFHNVDFLWPTITYLGSFLHRNGLTFDYVNLFQREKDKLIAKLECGNVRTVAITTTLYVTPQPITEIIELVRRHAPQAKVVVGGPFVANQTASLDERTVMALFKYLAADFYVESNEGERTLVELLRALRDGADLAAVDNLAFRSGDSYVRTHRVAERNELADNPVNYALFPISDIGQFVSLRTAKSCPFTCAFCGFPQRAGEYLYSATAVVERELDALKQLGTVTTLTFLDDTFNVPKKRFKEILRLMERKGYGFRWNSFYRSDHGDPETIELMAAAGCEGVFLGIESGSDRQLERMNKTSRRRHYLDAIPRFRAAGISAYASVIVGFPGETADTVAESADLIETAAPDFFRAQLWYADPITPIWQRREEFGVTGEAFNWAHATMDSAEACSHIDHLFLSIENSVWMPQNGFEQWSTFYLQRHGWSLGGIKEFLRAFNDGIKERLLFGDSVEVSPRTLARIAACSRPGAGLLEPSSLYDPSSYNAVVAAWRAAIGPAWPPSKLPALGGSHRATHGRWMEIDCPVERNLLELAQPSSPGPAAAWLAVFGIALSRLDGDSRLPVAAMLDLSGQPTALPLMIDEGVSFATLVDSVADAYRLALATPIFAPIVIRHLYARGVDPVIDVGVRLHRSAATSVGSADFTAIDTALAGGLALVLEIRPDAIALVFDADRIDPAAADTLADYIVRIAEAAAHDPLATVETLGVAVKPPMVAQAAADAFNF